MPEPTFSVNLTPTTSLFDAFKTLTVDRTKNAGTLEVVMKDGQAVELKCSHHRFYNSGNFTVPKQDAHQLRELLLKAVRQEIEQATNLKMLELVDTKGWKLDSKFLLNAVDALVRAVDEKMSISGDSRLLRADIKPIIENLEDMVNTLKGLDVDTLLDTPAKELLDRLLPRFQSSAPAEAPMDKTQAAPGGGSPQVEQPKADAAHVDGGAQSVEGAKAANVAEVETKPVDGEELQNARNYMAEKDKALADLLVQHKNATFDRKVEKVSAFMKACFDDMEFRKASALVAKAEGFTITKSSDVKAAKVNAKGLPALGAIRKQQFHHEIGSTDAVGLRYHVQFGTAGKKICVQDYADSTLTFGGIFKNWNTQEETLFRQAGLAMFGALFADNLTEKDPNPQSRDYLYTRNAETGRPNLETHNGVLWKGRMDRVGLETLPDGPIPMYYLLTSAPALPTDGVSFDPHNDINCAIAHRARAGEPEPDKAHYENGLALFDAIKQGGHGKETTRKMLRIAMFSSEIDLFNISDATARKAVLDKLAADIEGGKMDDVLTKIDNESYGKGLQDRFDKWAKLCADSGIDYMIGGPVGCGAFGNDPQKVARAMARAWAKYGNGDYVYAQYKDFDNGGEDETAQIFHREFEEAQRMKVKLLLEDGYEITEIVAHMKEGGDYTQDEIMELLANAGYTRAEARELLG